MSQPTDTANTNQPTNNQTEAESLTFWQHLEVLRWSIIRMLVAIVLLSVVAFCFREWMFTIVMAPATSSFVTYRLINSILPTKALLFDIDIINTELAGQFMTHIEVSLLIGLLIAIPYLLYEVFRFISPALYQSEKKVTIHMVILSYVLFMLGLLVAYFVIFPFTVLFLGSYQVVAEVHNMIALNSYISTMIILLLMMGLIFELPILCYLLARIGLLHYEWLHKYRKHAIVVIICLAAIITPSGDAFTMLLTALPLYIIFEVSMLVVKRTKPLAIKE